MSNSDQAAIADGMKNKIDNFINSIYADEVLASEVAHLQQTLQITNEQVAASWLLWDTAIRSYSNDVYSSEALRLVMHLHNYLKGSWHVKRQEVVLRYLQQIKTDSICEIGFGTPQKYVRELLKLPAIRILLGDFEQSSIEFAANVLGHWDVNWKDKVSLTLFDLNKNDLPGGYQTYIFQDSSEHANNPTGVLQKYVSSVPAMTYFIFSLPIEIENPIPEHHICWENEDQVLQWLENAGLEILQSETIHMNKEVDIFSLSLHPEFREIVILARSVS
jgi:hypothetical protein